MPTKSINFCASSKSGLGHLRRLTNIAREINKLDGSIPINMFTNRELAGLCAQDYSLYHNVRIVERERMARELELEAGPVVVDTAVIVGLAELSQPLCLLLRETRSDQVSRFRLTGSRRWNLVISPHPENHWSFDPNDLGADRVAEVGWIYRIDSRNSTPECKSDRRFSLLVASGGGGDGPKWSDFRDNVEKLLRQLKRRFRQRLCIEQVIGPRASEAAKLASVDRYVSPGSELPRYFSRADLVISTAGYNSTLELALTDTPTLFIPIKTRYDNQKQRAEYFGKTMGKCYSVERHQATVEWLNDVIEHGWRRQPQQLGHSGAEQAARLILGLGR